MTDFSMIDFTSISHYDVSKASSDTSEQTLNTN